jgi:hypothetical protein
MKNESFYPRKVGMGCTSGSAGRSAKFWRQLCFWRLHSENFSKRGDS